MNTVLSALTQSTQSTRTRRPIAAAAVVMLMFAGCSDEQRRDLGEEDVRDMLSGRVEDAVADGDLELDGDLDCSADITDDQTVTASCTGTTATGEALSGTLDGTADVDSEECTADLAITIGDDVTNEPAVDCFDVG